MTNKKSLTWFLVFTLLFGMALTGCDTGGGGGAEEEPEPEDSLNGTWSLNASGISNNDFDYGNNIKMNNGSFETSDDGISSYRGSYSAVNDRITLSVTHVHGNVLREINGLREFFDALDSYYSFNFTSKWYSESDLKTEFKNTLGNLYTDSSFGSVFDFIFYTNTYGYNAGDGILTLDGIPTVSSVTVSAEDSAVSVVKGNTIQFSANVTGNYSPAQTVTWSIVETGKDTETTISSSGLLTVAEDETLTALTVKATSTVDTTKSGTREITIKEPTVVSFVSVSAEDGAVSVETGASLQFSAEVTGKNDPAQDVIWSIVETGIKEGTTISSSGLLTVAGDETLTTLTVKATSTVDTTKSGTKQISLTIAVPTVSYVKINGTGGVYRGNNLQFSASVIGEHNPDQTVTWSIVETDINAGTYITDDGYLSVDYYETLSTFTVKATSTFDTTKSGTIKISLALRAPSSVSAKPGDYNYNYDVSWSSVLGATSYDVAIRSALSGEWTDVGNFTGTSCVARVGHTGYTFINVRARDGDIVSEYTELKALWGNDNIITLP